MPQPKVTVRMYQGLLGDCFLIRLFDPAATDRTQPAAANILIDCGVLQNVPDEEARIARVTRDIAQITDNRLDLLVVTHEHYDHVSGFGHARDLFLDGAIKIGKLWLAWTEKPGDDRADELRGMFVKSKGAIATGVQRMRAAAASDAEFHLDGDAAGLEAFIGPDCAALGARSGGLTVAQILAGLKQRLEPRTEYLEPGEAHVTPGDLGLRAYVLGPPREGKWLFKGLPSSNPERRETYVEARELEAAEIARNLRYCEESCGLDSMPFSARHQRPSDKVVLDPAAALPPDASDKLRNLWAIREKYLDPQARHQQIHTDWHGAVGQLAMKLDSDTNNTSLVLAFELEPGGDVMLFAADAQVGNWLSWHERDYPADLADPAARVTAAELLARTTLYKVGHHGSHNATLRAKGLEMMTSDRLTALIPVMEDVAARRRWKMPYATLYDALLLKTQGRVLRGDRSPDAQVIAAQPDFNDRVRSDPAPDAKLGSKWIEFDVC